MRDIRFVRVRRVVATLLVTMASVIVASSVGECVDSLSNSQLSLSASSLVSACACECVCVHVYINCKN